MNPKPTSPPRTVNCECLTLRKNLARHLLVFSLLTSLPTACDCARAADKAAPRPHIVAHRGLLRLAPENTLSNFRACLNLRIGFEFDIRRAKDGQLVCLHDDTIDRTTDGKGKVGDYTVEQLQLFDAGSWFDPAFRDERIPTIDQVFALIAEHRHRPLLFAADMKGDDPNIEADVVKLADRHGILDRLLFIGRTIDHPEVRRRLKQANPKAHIAALANRPEEFEKALTDADPDWVYLRFVPTAPKMNRVHEAGKKAFIAGPTVAAREEENWRKSYRAGIDAILTDYPHELAEIIRSPEGMTRAGPAIPENPDKEFADLSLTEQQTIARLKFLGATVFRYKPADSGGNLTIAKELRIIIPDNWSGDDADLKLISRLPTTRDVYVVGNTHISDAALEKLREALPDIKVQRRGGAMLGVSGENQDNGLLVKAVHPGSGAAVAGIRAGDVLVECAGRPVTKFDDLTQIIRAMKPDQQVEVVLLRDQERKTLKVTLTGWK